MTTAIVFEIVDLALSLERGQLSGTAPADATVADTLLQIIQKGALAYAQHMGQTLDPSLVKVETPV